MQENESTTVKNSRSTQQRRVILEELQKVTSHPTAEEMYGIVKKILPKISLGTVYRNLDFLAETGEIRKIDSAGAVRRFDGDISPHMHARCLCCEKIIDIFETSSIDLGLENMKLNSFTIFSASIMYEGICHDCENLQKETSIQ